MVFGPTRAASSIVTHSLAARPSTRGPPPALRDTSSHLGIGGLEGSKGATAQWCVFAIGTSLLPLSLQPTTRRIRVRKQGEERAGAEVHLINRRARRGVYTPSLSRPLALTTTTRRDNAPAAAPAHIALLYRDWRGEGARINADACVRACVLRLPPVRANVESTLRPARVSTRAVPESVIAKRLAPYRIFFSSSSPTSQGRERLNILRLLLCS